RAGHCPNPTRLLWLAILPGGLPIRMEFRQPPSVLYSYHTPHVSKLPQPAVAAPVCTAQHGTYLEPNGLSKQNRSPSRDEPRHTNHGQLRPSALCADLQARLLVQYLPASGGQYRGDAGLHTNLPAP